MAGQSMACSKISVISSASLRDEAIKSHQRRVGRKPRSVRLDGNAATTDRNDLMGTLQQQTQRKPAMVILTTMVRVTMPAARRLRATKESTPLLSPVDSDAEPGRGRYAECY
jgi:hypothetical protein